MPRTVFIFGVFDGVHDGHRFFITEAQKLGEPVIISVARDEVSFDLKGRKPKYSLQERMHTLEELFPETTVIPGDATTGSWEGLQKYQPNVIALGYDQTDLKDALETARGILGFPFELITIPDHRGDELHSRLLNK
jgi:FAD synthetase